LLGFVLKTANVLLPFFSKEILTPRFGSFNPAEAQPKFDELQAEFPSAQIKILKVDITDEPAVSKAVEETARVLGSVDILLCFAGVVSCHHAIDIKISEWKKTLDVNTTGTFICAQAVGRQMIAQGTGGSIVFIASISGHRVNFPQPQVAYNVSKASLLTLKSCLAAEWARYGIRVNSISPGYMDTSEFQSWCKHDSISQCLLTLFGFSSK